MKSWATKSSAIGALSLVVALAAGCGENRPSSNDEPSAPEWTQSRTGSTRYAYLQAADLTDDFLFGASVIKVTDFQSSALDMLVNPMKVKLKLRGTSSSRKLDVSTPTGELLMSFNVKVTGTKYEVDFASAGNDVQLRGLIDQLGGAYTAGSNDGYWVSQGAPKVLNVSQDNDTMVVDLLHTISQAVLKADGQSVDHVVSDHPGKVQIRLFLKRAKVLPRLGVNRSVAQGKSHSIGFFGPDMGAASDDIAIQRFALGDATDAQQSITFYLKDVPAAFQGVATSAILSWNKAFDHDVIKVAVAPASMDVGDPRLNVVKWFDGLDEATNWAGVAKMLVEPDTGLVMGGDLYINGSTVLNMYKGVVKFSQQIGGAAGTQNGFNGTIGSMHFNHAAGEAPVIPFITDLSKNYDDYMQGYYQETIAHETGHVLGLRHNFRGTTALENGESASVMDYAPRSDRDHYKGPGSYDVAAIRWGYYGQEPAGHLAFCTDEDIWTYFDCSQGDWGDAVQSAINGLQDGTKVLTQKAVAITDDVFISSMGGALENALKIKKLNAQLPSSTRAGTLAKIDAAYKYLYNATPDASLQGAALTTVKANLEKLHALAKKTESDLHTAGHL